MKLQKTVEDGEATHTHRLAEVILLKVIYRLNSFHIKIPMASTEIKNPKLTWEFKNYEQLKEKRSIKRSNAGDAKGPGFKQSHSNKTSMILVQTSHINQQNQKEDPEINPNSYEHKNIGVGDRNIYLAKELQQSCREDRISTCIGPQEPFFALHKSQLKIG